MTITYPNGAVLKAIVLSHEEHEIRAVAAGCDDVMVLSLIHGTWISEELEPVTLQFEWQRSVTPLACSEDDCICPKELAAHLIWSLVVGCEGEVVANGPFVLSPEGSRVAEQAIQNDGRPLSIC